MAPPSQKFRQIGFFLEGPTAPPALLDLFIRPEDLSRQEPSRLTIQQTLGGAWADSWDRGVSTITLSGHCGWRGGFGLSGEDGFAALRDIVFAGWHAQRAAAVKAGVDPNTVTLTYIDALDSIVALVAPKSFQLRRSKSSPLLMRYSIQLAVLDDTNAPLDPLDAVTLAITNPLRWLAGVTGLTNMIATIQGWLATAQAAASSIQAAIGSFVATGVALVQSVVNLAQAAQGVLLAPAAIALGVAQSVALAGRTMFSALAAVAAIPVNFQAALMGMAAAWNDVLCTMSNCFSASSTYPDYSALYGASGCSSTGGGLPASTFTVNGTNPFAALVPAAPPVVSVSVDASAALAQMSGDPLPLIGQTATIGAAMATIGSGVTVAPT